MFVYFIFAGYRVAIGRTNRLSARVSNYRRTHTDVFLLGVIPCDSKADVASVETDILNRFKASKATERDLFYLTSEMLQWIVENTIAHRFQKKNKKKAEKEKCATVKPGIDVEEMSAKGVAARRKKACERRIKVAKLKAENLSGTQIAKRLGEKPRTIYQDFAILKRRNEKAAD